MMRAVLDIPQTDPESTLRVWRAAFDVDANPLSFAHAAALLKVSRGDIYSGKLPYTAHFFGAIANGGVQLIRGPEADMGLPEILDILALIAMHNRLARTAIAPLRAPAVWMRDHVHGEDPGVERETFRPVLPFSQMESLAGISETVLRSVLQPIMRDGALRAVNLPNGAEGVFLVDGFVSLGNVRRYFKV